MKPYLNPKDKSLFFRQFDDKSETRFCLKKLKIGKTAWRLKMKRDMLKEI